MLSRDACYLHVAIARGLSEEMGHELIAKGDHLKPYYVNFGSRKGTTTYAESSKTSFFTMYALHLIALSNTDFSIFKLFFKSTDLKSIKTNEGLLYWLCSNKNEAYRNHAMRFLLANNQYLALEQNITEQHIMAALGALPQNEQDLGTPDINGLYPYHYAIVAHQANFTAWLPKNHSLTIDEGYYQGVTVTWWLAYHFTSFFLSMLDKKKETQFVFDKDIKLEDCPRNMHNPLFGLTILQWLSRYCEIEAFLQIIQDHFLAKVNFNDTINDCTILNELVDYTSSGCEIVCAWLNTFAKKCPIFIDLIGTGNQRGKGKPYLYHKFAESGYYNTIRILLEHPEYPISDLFDLLEVINEDNEYYQEGFAKEGHDYAKLSEEGEDAEFVDYTRLKALVSSSIAQHIDDVIQSLPANVELDSSDSNIQEIQAWLTPIITMFMNIPQSFPYYSRTQAQFARLLMKFSVNLKVSQWLIAEFFTDDQFQPSNMYVLPATDQMKFIIMTILKKGGDECNELFKPLLSELLFFQTQSKATNNPLLTKKRQMLSRSSDSFFQSQGSTKKNKSQESEEDYSIGELENRP